MTSWIDEKLGICLLLSVVAHFAIERGLQQLPKHVDPVPPQQVSVRVIEPDPPKEPEKPPEPKPPEPTPKTAEIPKARPVHSALVAPVAKDAPAPEHPAVQTSADSTDATSAEWTGRAFGISAVFGVGSGGFGSGGFSGSFGGSGSITRTETCCGGSGSTCFGNCWSPRSIATCAPTESSRQMPCFSSIQEVTSAAPRC